MSERVLLGKRIVYVFHGSDSRPPYLDGYQQRARRPGDLVAETRWKKRAIATIERYADAIVCTPIHTHLHERTAIAYQRIGIPVAYDEDRAEVVRPPSPGVRILHAPSAPENKGTAVIRAAVERLRARGYAIDYVELSGRPHREVVAELEACDLVVDQLYGEGPIGGFATEAAFFGKPAVLGTHTDEIWRIYATAELPPVARCRNEDIEETIRQLLDDPGRRASIGAAACAFVRTQWTPRQVALRFRLILTGDVPGEWLFDPRSVRDVHGAGLPEERLRAVLAAYIAEGGVAALGVADKPGLERALVAFAAGAAS